MRTVLLAAVAAWLAAPWPVPGAEAPKAEAPAPVLAIFPFQSPDGGEAGRKFADRMHLRARRLDLVIVDSMSLKDAMSGAAMPTVQTPPTAVAVLLKERLAADLALWGEVRPRGQGLEIQARGLDVRGGAMETLSETFTADQPQLLNPVQDAILEKLTGRRKAAVPEATPEADARVATVGPNLVANGGFESGAKHPDGWDRLDGLTTFRVAGEGPTGKCLKMDTDVYHNQWVEWRRRWKDGAEPEAAPPKAPTSGPKYDTVAGIYGVEFVSAPIPVKPGRSYKVEVDYRCASTDFFFPKLFIRGYGDVGGEKRVVYDAYLALRSLAETDRWKHNVRIIMVPTDAPAPVEFVRLKLYAYWPPGVYYFDNVSMKEVATDKR
jgi:hypothetical protein